MEITEVRIKLMEEAGERLQAFCSITFDDCFVIRDLKIIEGSSGPFVAMPSRKLTAHCPGCGCKNHLRAAHCNQCGLRLKDDRAVKDEDGRSKLYADIAHPINSMCREMIQERVIRSFQEEIEKSRLPGYVSSYDDFDEESTFAGAGRDSHHGRRSHHERKEAASSHNGTAVLENARVSTAEAEPRPPHKPAGHQGGAKRTEIVRTSEPHKPPEPSKLPDGPKRGAFGAGIL